MAIDDAADQPYQWLRVGALRSSRLETLLGLPFFGWLLLIMYKFSYATRQNRFLAQEHVGVAECSIFNHLKH